MMLLTTCAACAKPLGVAASAVPSDAPIAFADTLYSDMTLSCTWPPSSATFVAQVVVVDASQVTSCSISVLFGLICFGRGRRRRVVKVRVVAALGCLFGVCACSRGAPASCGPHGRLLGVRARRRSRIRGLKCGRLAARRGAAVTPSMTRLVAIFESSG